MFKKSKIREVVLKPGEHKMLTFDKTKFQDNPLNIDLRIEGLS
jgi:hypothetical protein